MTRSQATSLYKKRRLDPFRTQGQKFSHEEEQQQWREFETFLHRSPAVTFGRNKRGATTETVPKMCITP